MLANTTDSVSSKNIQDIFRWGFLRLGNCNFDPGFSLNQQKRWAENRDLVVYGQNKDIGQQ
jgi:hypothetical protein